MRAYVGRLQSLLTQLRSVDGSSAQRGRPMTDVKQPLGVRTAVDRKALLSVVSVYTLT